MNAKVGVVDSRCLGVDGSAITASVGSRPNVHRSFGVLESAAVLPTSLWWSLGVDVLSSNECK